MTSPNRSSHSLRRGLRQALTWVLAAAALPVAFGQSAGQPPSQPAGDDEVSVTIQDVVGQGRLIQVPANKSVLIEFSRMAREARIANPEFAEVSPISPRQLLLTGKSFGTTQLIVWFDGGAQKVFDVAVDLEQERLLASVRTAVPRARVRAHALMNSIVLTGDVPDAPAAEKIVEIAKVFAPQVVNHMQVRGGQQVLLRCTVAEINRSASRKLGFNGWLGGDNLRDVFFVQNLNNINPSNIGAVEGASPLAAMPFAVAQGGIPITDQTTLSFGFPRVQMQVFIQAMRENGLLRVLAEPNLVAVNGQKATFLAGGEVPIPISTSDKIKIEYKEFGIRLNFTPAVLGEGRLRLLVAPEVSEPDFSNSVTFGGIAIPGFSTRRVQTTVEVGEGETIAIGGLLSQKTRGVITKIPGLGDIPVLGALFRSVDYQTDETELVVLVTPELAAGVSPDEVTFVPGANYVEPNDFELYMLGEMDGKPSRDLPVLQPRVNNVWPAQPADLYGEQALKLRGPVGPAGWDEGT